MRFLGVRARASVPPPRPPPRRRSVRRVRRRSTTTTPPGVPPPPPPEGKAGALLFLSPSLWPAPSRSAAGVRTSSLLRHFAADSDLFGSVHYGCGARLPPDPPTADPSAADLSELRRFGVRFRRVRPNRSGEMGDLLTSLGGGAGGAGAAVVFDRFFSEEAYSFRVREIRPDALRVLDMQDMHSLRAARGGAVERWDASDGGGGPMMTDPLMERITRLAPTHLSEDRRASDAFLREMASVHRSDLALVCSPREVRILEGCGVRPSKLVPAPFFAREVSEMYDSPELGYESRSDFVSLGGFRHPPNADSALWLSREVWPRIRSRLPSARLHVYGADPTRRVRALHDEASGFLVMGRADDLGEALGRARVLLAPLRYGAGIKGKVVDGWRYGVPVVTTPVGAEGTTPTDDAYNRVATGERGDNMGWGGIVAPGSADSIASCAVRLHSDRDLWEEARSDARGLLRSLFGERNLSAVEGALGGAMAGLARRREEDLTGALLWHQGSRSVEYFSRWIELKETGGPGAPVVGRG